MEEKKYRPLNMCLLIALAAIMFYASFLACRWYDTGIYLPNGPTLSYADANMANNAAIAHIVLLALGFAANLLGLFMYKPFLSVFATILYVAAAVMYLDFYPYLIAPILFAVIGTITINPKWPEERPAANPSTICLGISVFLSTLYILAGILFLSDYSSTMIDTGNELMDFLDQLDVISNSITLYYHLVGAGLALIFNIAGLASRKKGLVMAGAVFYFISAVQYIPYTLGTAIPGALSIIAFALMCL